MEILAGFAIGSVVGLLVGLSTSPVVSSALAALLAIATTFIGLEVTAGKVSASASSGKMVAFCIGLAAFLVIGITSRSYQWMAPSPSVLVERWTSANFEEELARDLVVFEKYGILPAGTEKASDAAATPTSASLFTDVNAGDCASLSIDMFRDARDRLKAMVDVGGPWLAVSIAASLQGEELSQFLQDKWEELCRQ